MKTVLIAVGGNALFDKEGTNNIDPRKLQVVCTQIVSVIQMGYQPVVTFGNGPQVGNLLEMAEQYTKPPAWPIPLDVCVAWTQGEIGYFLSKALYNDLQAYNVQMPVMAINTTVVVDPQDPAFINATKPVGNFFTRAQAEQMAEERGWQMKQDADRGYRRVVPSPKPQQIIEEEPIRQLVAGGCVILCGGGGGIPVAMEDGMLRGVEAVIDKDYTTCLLGKRLGIETLIICTEIDNLYLNYGTPQQEPIQTLTTKDAKRHLVDGQFPPGSMGPKIEALLDFIEQGGKSAILCKLETLKEALKGQAGTKIIP